MQTTLSEVQLAEFYHDQFVEDQVRDFTKLLGSRAARVADVGGGCGFFASRLRQQTGSAVRVIDSDPASVRTCQAAGLEAVCGDALSPAIASAQDVVTFNLMLHHLVGATEEVTAGLQRRAVGIWRSHAQAVFVNEYIYESFVASVSGWLIYQITSSPLLSWMGRTASRLIPSLRANTFGVGVRFRAHDEWIRLFNAAGFDVKSSVRGNAEAVSPLWRLLLIRRISRDSFHLVPRRTDAEQLSLGR